MPLTAACSYPSLSGMCPTAEDHMPPSWNTDDMGLSKGHKAERFRDEFNVKVPLTYQDHGILSNPQLWNQNKPLEPWQCPSNKQKTKQQIIQEMSADASYFVSAGYPCWCTPIPELRTLESLSSALGFLCPFPCQLFIWLSIEHLAGT